jgi:hypothetical protein
MSTYLANKMARLHSGDKEKITAITVFEDWLAEVSLLDEEYTDDLKRIADFATEHIAKKQRLDNSSKPSHYSMYQQQPARDYPPPVSGANAITSKTYAPSQNNFRGNFNAPTGRASKRFRCAKLLPIEYDLLEKHNGCRKCRRFYVNHQVANCPNDFPDPDTYVTLTEEMAHKAMASAAIASTYSSHNSSSNTPSYSQPSTAFVEDVPAT